MTPRARPHRRDGFVLAAAVGRIGVTYGGLADTAGLTLAQAGALSVLTFAGSSQFAGVSVIDGGGNPVSADLQEHYLFKMGGLAIPLPANPRHSCRSV